MRFSTSFLAALAFVLPAVFAAPTSFVHDVQTYNGPKKTGSYIVKLKDGVDKAAHLDWLARRASDSEVTHDWNSEFLNAFAGEWINLLQ